MPMVNPVSVRAKPAFFAPKRANNRVEMAWVAPVSVNKLPKITPKPKTGAIVPKVEPIPFCMLFSKSLGTMPALNPKAMAVISNARNASSFAKKMRASNSPIAARSKKMDIMQEPKCYTGTASPYICARMAFTLSLCRYSPYVMVWSINPRGVISIMRFATESRIW